MSAKNYKPDDLADYVLKILKKGSDALVIPEIDILTDLFEILFYASLNTEEGDFIKVTVSFYNPDQSKPTTLKRRKKDRWRYVPFKTKLPFDIKTLVKLSKAADPWSSSLAIYYDEVGKLWIHGLIDQALQVQSYLHYEIDTKPEQPGLFQVSITDVGCLSVLRDYELIASLKQNVLVTKYQDVLKFGAISEILKNNSLPIKEEIKSFLENNFSEQDFDDWEDFIDEICSINILVFLVINTK